MSSQGSCCGGGRRDRPTREQREDARAPSDELRGPTDTCGCEEARGGAVAGRIGQSGQAVEDGWIAGLRGGEEDRRCGARSGDDLAGRA